MARGEPKALLGRCSTVLLQGEEVAMSEAVFFYILTVRARPGAVERP